MLGSIVKTASGSYTFQFGQAGQDAYVSKHFSIEKFGSSAKAKAAALAFQKEIQPKLKVVRKGKSALDKIFKRNKKFRDFVDDLKKTEPKYKNFVWEETPGNPKNIKSALYKRFQNELKYPKKAGYDIKTKQMAGLLGLDETYFDKLTLRPERKADKFIIDNFPKIQRIEDGRLINFYKADPKKIEKFKTLFGGDAITLAKDTEKRVYEIDKKFRKTIVTDKKLPNVFTVMENTSANTPSKAASAMAAYSKVLRGELFRNDFTIKPNEAAGKRIITQLGDTAKRNEYRTAFYRLALSNVDKEFNKQGTLSDFRKDFNKSLRKVMNLPEGANVPYNVNEVISLSAGESRNIRPFSVFIDASLSDINQKSLATYQGVLSDKVSRVEDLISKNKISEAKKVAASLKDTQKQVGKTLLDQGYTQRQIKQLNLPDIVVGEDVTKTYSPETLSRYKDAGIDIGQFAKDRKFYIDVKKAKPFWESNIRNTIVAAAQNNTGNVCNIFAGRVAFSKDGGRIGFQGGCGKEMAAAMEADAPGTLNKVSQTEGVLSKFKNVALGFLKSPLARGTGKFGALATAGAATAGVVKKFMNDDPTSYLSNEDQQKNMLIDMVTGSLDDTPQERPAILDYQLPVLGGAAVAGTAVTAPSTIAAARSRAFGKTPSGITKTTLKTLGRGLGALGTPLGLLATEPLFLASQVQQGDSLAEIATDPMNYLGAAFVGPIDRFATKGLSPQIAKTMRLGISPSVLKTVSRRFGLPGLALSAGISGYEMFDDYRNKRGMFSEE
jgi:hypothetical protein